MQHVVMLKAVQQRGGNTVGSRVKYTARPGTRCTLAVARRKLSWHGIAGKPGRKQGPAACPGRKQQHEHRRDHQRQPRTVRDLGRGGTEQGRVRCQQNGISGTARLCANARCER